MIGQQAHAWVSGQLARAWGNERFEEPAPREQVCLAAEQHDLGMTSFDMEPTLDRETGLPHSFMEMPLELHLSIWEAAPRRMLVQDRYAALLVSMHGTALYERRDLGRMEPADAEAVRSFLGRQRDLQRELTESLRADPATAPAATDELIARNQRLIWTFDSLSLALLLGWDPLRLDHVGVELRGSTLDPWPLREDSLTVRCDARRLAGPCASEEALHAALAAAPWETVELTLSRLG